MGSGVDFGHFSANGPGFHIDIWGGAFVINDGKRSWRFEFSDRFGPLLTRKDGMPMKRQPISERDPFWWPFTSWLAQGKQVEKDGVTCIWTKPKPTIVRPVKVKGRRRRQMKVVEYGDEDGRIIVLEPPPGESHDG